MSKFRIERVRLDDITIDGRVQRNLELKRVADIAEDFDWGAFGVPTLSRRADGTIVIIDGMHRVMAARKAGHGDRAPQLKVHTGLTLTEEARLFRMLNNTRKPSSVDLFLVAVTEGEPAAVEMNELIEAVGLKVATAGAKAFRAVTALRRIYAIEPDAAVRTLDVATRAWGADSTSVQSAIVEGLGGFFLRYGDQPNADELGERLAKYAGGANGLIGAARGLARIRSVSVPNGVSDIVVEVYNKGRRTRALAPWVTGG